MADPFAVTGLILAGGRARRMDGNDKGLVPLAGRPLVAHVIERFAPQVGALLINANRNHEAYAAFGHPVIADALPDFAGPLAGLHAALQACGTPLLATVPCDAPRLPSDLVARLLADMQAANAPAAVAFAGERLQPTFMLCRREVLVELERYLAADGRRIHTWLEGIGARAVAFANLSAFVNVNTPSDLAELESPACRETDRSDS